MESAVALKAPIPVPEPRHFMESPAHIQPLALSRGEQSDALCTQISKIVAGTLDQGRGDAPPLIASGTVRP